MNVDQVLKKIPGTLNQNAKEIARVFDTSFVKML